ncbi:MAG: hypothetical protein MK085_01350 [Phycisphaerales bacterium]|nr:hypothetical protein [Phycisphaerales bacterium]
MKRNSWQIIPLLLAATIPWGLGGCASTPRESDDSRAAKAAPEDLVIDSTVLVGDKILFDMERAGGVGWPVHLRPSRAIVMPDGALRAELGVSLGVDDRPGLTRQLYRDQVSTLWNTLWEYGFHVPEPGDLRGNPALLEPAKGEVIQVLTIRANGEGWSIVRRFTPEQEEDGSLAVRGKAPGEDPRMRAFLRRLLALAWASDLPSDGTFSIPERYDFGPDPWDRYRREAAVQEATEE